MCVFRVCGEMEREIERRKKKSRMLCKHELRVFFTKETKNNYTLIQLAQDLSSVRPSRVYIVLYGAEIVGYGTLHNGLYEKRC